MGKNMFIFSGIIEGCIKLALLMPFVIIAGCSYIFPTDDNRDQYRDIELMDSLRLHDGKILYSYKYTHFRSVADAVYYSVLGTLCEMDSTNAILMTPSGSFMNGITNDSVNIILTGSAFEERIENADVRFRFLHYEYGQKYEKHRELYILKSEKCK